MDASPLFYKDRVEQHFDRAQYHFPRLKRVDNHFLVNNSEAFLGNEERKVYKMFRFLGPPSVIRARLEPSSTAWVVRAIGKGYDCVIITGGAFEAFNYLKTRGPIAAAYYSHPVHTYKPADLSANYDLVVLQGAEAYLQVNPWLLRVFA
jgi:hypothetical protein